MKRPVGISILAIALALLVFAGFGNAYFTVAQPGDGTLMLAVLALVYGVAALVASVGLWKRQRWAYWAFLSWVATALLAAIAAQLMFVQAPWPKLLAFLVIEIGVLWALARYVRKASLPVLLSFETDSLRRR